MAISLAWSVIQTKINCLVDFYTLFASVKKIYHSIDVQIDIQTQNQNILVEGNVILENVFLNLLTIGVKYRKQNVPKTIIRINVIENNQGVLISFEDFGVGIPDESKDSIFSRFTASSTSISGTGLGLSISKRIISLMNGDIKVENLPEYPNDYTQGSCFTIQFQNRI